jgi:hypothetical protein
MTNLICTSGGQLHDWSADYRLYSEGRADLSALFAPVLHEVLHALPPEAPLVVALDDTLLRKTGTYVDGVAWRRDPLGPPFQTNLVRAQRFLQMSAAWPLKTGGRTHGPRPFSPRSLGSKTSQRGHRSGVCRLSRAPQTTATQCSGARSNGAIEQGRRKSCGYCSLIFVLLLTRTVPSQ